MKTITFGFTGTRKGMSERQKKMLSSVFWAFTRVGYRIIFHHGDCIGSDAEADNIARNYKCEIHIHPPENPKFRAFCYQDGDILYPERGYVQRDKDIVNACVILFAAPKDEKFRQLRSGTWTTVRYAEAAILSGRRLDLKVDILAR